MPYALCLMPSWAAVEHRTLPVATGAWNTQGLHQSACPQKWPLGFITWNMAKWTGRKHLHLLALREMYRYYCRFLARMRHWAPG